MMPISQVREIVRKDGEVEALECIVVGEWAAIVGDPPPAHLCPVFHVPSGIGVPSSKLERDMPLEWRFHLARALGVLSPPFARNSAEFEALQRNVELYNEGWKRFRDGGSR